MAEPTFPNLSDEARLWVYVADRSLSDDEQASLLEALRSFFQDWTSHGRAVNGAATLRDNRMLLVGGEIPDADISGCGIDASVNVVEEAAARADVSWLSPLNVAYRDDEGRLQTVSRPAFRKLVDDGRVTGATSVFDPSIDRVGALREGALEKPAADSWHGQAFDLTEPAPA